MSSRRSPLEINQHLDPQMVFGQMTVPAHTILQEFERAKADVSTNPMLAHLWAPRLVALPPGYLNLCEQTIKLAEAKVKQWLGQYMFCGKNPAQAEAIAKWLASFDENQTHGRPIGIELARQKGLNVTALEDNQALQEGVPSVFHATMVTFQSTVCLKVIENHRGKGRYAVAQLFTQPVPQANMPVP